MSMIIERNNGSRLNFCRDEAESEFCSDVENLEPGLVEKRTNGYSIETDCTIVYDSTNLSRESSPKIIFESTKNRPTDNAYCNGKRRRVLSSSSEESSEQRSRSVSPEITYGGTPVAYKLHELKGQLLIIKVPMSKPQARAQKCSDRDIADMLDSDSESESMFDRVKKSGARIVGSLPEESNNLEAACTPKKVTKKLPRTTRTSSKDSSTDNTPSKYSTTEVEEVSLIMKLRRSTEQSNYKIQMVRDVDERKCRSSQRTTMSTPKRCGFGDCDEDHGTPKKTRASPKTPRKSQVSSINEARTPSARRTRKISSMINANCSIIEEYNCHENGSNENDSGVDDESDRAVTPRRATARALANEDSKTPQKRIEKLSNTDTPRSTRTRRNSKLISYNYNVLDDFLDKENKSENDNDEESEGVGSRVRGRRKMAKPIVGTPQKQIKYMEEATTPKRTTRKSVVEKLELSTPKKTTRKSVVEKLELATPKRTPRKSVVEKLELATPKRTPRRSAMAKIDEPMTPTMTGRRISRVNTPSMKNGSLTPSMSRRTANIGKPITILEEARARLHVSAVPKSLPCREEEFNDIYQFLERKLLDNNGGCIYISGVPGTGKTATVNEVIRCLKKLVTKGDLENFDFIEINGMKLSEPRQAYVQILKQINGQAATWEQAYQILEKRFTKSSAKRPMTLLLVDELDMLCNKRQDVVYNLLDWPAKANAQLVVITIANTMDLPERVLMGRVTSRLGLTRLTFQPYNHKQLQKIVLARLKDSDAFKREAIQLVARKVAAVSGDARRALDICRRATEIAELNDEKIVTMQNVNQALTEMIASTKVQAIKHCSDMEKIFLQAVCAEVARTGVEETSFHNVYRQLESLCSFEGLKIPNITQTLGICGRLGANRLLLCEHSRTDTQQRILLNVSSDDIHFAMQTIAIV